MIAFIRNRLVQPILFMLTSMTVVAVARESRRGNRASIQNAVLMVMSGSVLVGVCMAIAWLQCRSWTHQYPAPLISLPPGSVEKKKVDHHRPPNNSISSSKLPIFAALFMSTTLLLTKSASASMVYVTSSEESILNWAKKLPVPSTVTLWPLTPILHNRISFNILESLLIQLKPCRLVVVESVSTFSGRNPLEKYEKVRDRIRDPNTVIALVNGTCTSFRNSMRGRWDEELEHKCTSGGDEGRRAVFRAFVQQHLTPRLVGSPTEGRVIDVNVNSTSYNYGNAIFKRYEDMVDDTSANDVCHLCAVSTNESVLTWAKTLSSYRAVTLHVLTTMHNEGSSFSNYDSFLLGTKCHRRLLVVERVSAFSSGRNPMKNYHKVRDHLNNSSTKIALVNGTCETFRIGMKGRWDEELERKCTSGGDEGRRAVFRAFVRHNICQRGQQEQCEDEGRVIDVGQARALFAQCEEDVEGDGDGRSEEVKVDNNRFCTDGDGVGSCNTHLEAIENSELNGHRNTESIGSAGSDAIEDDVDTDS